MVSNFKENTKQFIKKILKNNLIQIILSRIIALYMKLVAKTSRLVVNNKDRYLNLIKDDKGFFIVAWHGKMFIAPIILSSLSKEARYNRKMFFLASKHRDGKTAGEVMKIFGFEEISGSTINKDNKDKIEQAGNMGAITSIRKMMRELKNNNIICLPPDGPRGPIEEINSEVINIAKKMNVKILPASVSYSFKIRLKSWDKFQIPLPFGRILINFNELLLPDNYSNPEFSKKLLKERLDN